MSSDITAPAAFCKAVTLDADFTSPSRSILVGVAGNINVKMYGDGSTVTIPVVAGYNPIQATRINTAGTTATGLFYLW